MTGKPEAPTACSPIRDGWRLWLVIAFLAPIALVLWIKDVVNAR